MRDWLVEKRGDLTHEQVAKMAKISRSAYSNIESGKRNPSVEMAKAIAKALGFEWTIFFEKKSSRIETLKSSYIFFYFSLLETLPSNAEA
ncbi:helix-turn-helix transcriptional regulator [Aneurinibacillus terranovensis]|uniref:helix-turn-helix transcriptional regulator n=1 Tax=Aneurinibacillus terranovensis TaxID=278991 RepID=UPI00041E519D|nr:helix-turn-helix transcriptional regulator [Aneurinibacillus terranovensis]